MILVVFSYIALIAVTSLFGQPQFTEFDQFSSGYASHGLAIADYDGDSLLDVCIANSWGGPNQIYKNMGNLNFSLLGSFGYLESRGAAWGDYNNDGLLDLAIANSDGEQNKLYIQIGNSNFAIFNTFGLFNSFGISWADFDNDCDLDVAVSNANGDPNILYENNGNGNFQEHRVFGNGNSRGCSWGDYDNDGLPDLALAMREGGIEIYHNDGNGNFSVGYSSGTPMVVGVNWGDYENDGDLDLVAATLDNSNVYIFRNNNNTFELKQIAYKYRNSGVAWLDFDLDGDLDIVVGSYADYEPLSTLENVNDSVFVSYDISTDSLCIISLSVGDMDNDGDIDICLPVYWNNDQNKLFRNDLNATNYIKVHLRGRAVPGFTNYFGVGAKVKVYNSNDSLIRFDEINGGMGASMNAMEAIFGVSLSDTYTVVAEWPASGIIDTINNVSAPRELTIYEGWGLAIREGSKLNTKQPTSIFPNPSRDIFHIRYSVNKSTHVMLEIYDISGRLQKRVQLLSQKPGCHTFVWNGENTKGQPVPAGIYFLILEKESKRQSKRLIVIK